MRRCFQFRLRSLLLLMVICAVSCGWVGSNLRQWQAERAVIAGLEQVHLEDAAQLFLDVR